MKKTKIKIIILTVISILLVSSHLSVIAADKDLYFSEKDGQLYYESRETDHSSRFLSNDDLKPGEVYTDTMMIRNKTQSVYQIYLQMHPEEGLYTIQKKLLSLISMKIYSGSTLLYEGTADGITENATPDDITRRVSLGSFAPGASESFRVEYYLDWNNAAGKRGYYVKTEYEKWKKKGYPDKLEPVSYRTQEEAVRAARKAGVRGITYIEETSRNYIEKETKSIITGSRFLFSAERPDDKSDTLQPVLPPKTGDTTPVFTYVVLICASMAMIIFTGKKKKIYEKMEKQDR